MCSKNYSFLLQLSSMSNKYDCELKEANVSTDYLFIIYIFGWGWIFLSKTASSVWLTNVIIVTSQ